VTLAILPLFAQQAPPPASTPQSSSPSQESPSAPQQAPSTLSTAAAPPATAAQPDYPDPRTITIGIFGLSPLSSGNFNIKGGQVASYSGTYESLPNIGVPYHLMLQGEISVPVTRTGTIYAEFERFHGSATQIINRQTTIDTFTFNPNDDISSTYHIITGRIYLDDLLYPHKFPVSRFRLKSIWGMRYISVTQTVDSYLEDLGLGTPGASFGLGTSYIFFPEFGIAPEYAITPHLLFRAEASGFAFPHRSVIADTGATLSFRQKNLEVLAGVKGLHFKTSPYKEEYEYGTFITPFVGLRWHF
jgi:hypothetical protein